MIICSFLRSPFSNPLDRNFYFSPFLSFTFCNCKHWCQMAGKQGKEKGNGSLPHTLPIITSLRVCLPEVSCYHYCCLYHRIAWELNYEEMEKKIGAICTFSEPMNHISLSSSPNYRNFPGVLPALIPVFKFRVMSSSGQGILYRKKK